MSAVQDLGYSAEDRRYLTGIFCPENGSVFALRERSESLAVEAAARIRAPHRDDRDAGGFALVEQCLLCGLALGCVATVASAATRDHDDRTSAVQGGSAGRESDHSADRFKQWRFAA